MADDLAGERSVFRFYQRLIALRHESTVVALGDFALLEPDHETLYAFTRTHGDETLLVVANASDSPLTGPLPMDVSRADLVLANYPAATDAAAPTATTVLRPWEARLYRL